MKHAASRAETTSGAWLSAGRNFPGNFICNCFFSRRTRARRVKFGICKRPYCFPLLVLYSDTSSVWDCTFEQGLCSYTQLQDDQFDWTRNSGTTGTTGTGPPYDHTTGTGMLSSTCVKWGSICLYCGKELGMAEDCSLHHLMTTQLEQVCCPAPV